MPEAHAVRNLKASLERVLDQGQPDLMPSRRYDIRDHEETLLGSRQYPVFRDGQSVTILHHVAD